MTPLKIKIVKSSWYLNLTKIVRENKEKLKYKRTEKKKKTKQNTIENRSYETSNIWHTRDSEYWSWLRAKEWFNKFNDEKIKDFELQKQLKFLGVK